MDVRVSAQQAKLLLENAETHDLTARLLRDGADEAPLVLSGELDDLDALREACGDLLLRIGFDEGYAATPVGHALEGLIDKLYIEGNGSETVPGTLSDTP